VDTTETGDGGRVGGRVGSRDAGNGDNLDSINWTCLMTPVKLIRSNGALWNRLFVIVTASIDARNAIELIE
jgi:hypothetical protein